jgi:hypothetical protein
MAKKTTIRVDRETIDELFLFKRCPGDTYDDVLRRMMAETEHLKPRSDATETAD